MEKRFFIDKLAFLLATWFGVGLLPGAPGTAGSLAALPVGMLLAYLGSFYNAGIVLILTAVGIWSAGRVQHSEEDKDPSVVVIDEVAGFLVTMMLLPYNRVAICVGFALFRVFDILKPYPIRKLEEIRGGVGIVADDVLAGLYAFVCTKVVLYFISWTEAGLT